MIEKVEVLGFVTGKNSKNDTLSRFRVGGTDLGMPYIIVLLMKYF